MENSENKMEIQKPQFAEPSMQYKDSYLDALKEYNEVDGDKIDIEEREKNFEGFISKLEADKKPQDPNRVPSFEYWYVNGDRYIGKINYRSELNDSLRLKGGNVGYSIRPSERGKGYATEMMKYIIEKAKNEGQKELLLSCDSDNVASIKVIEKSGGILKDTGVDENKVPINRYIISLI